MDSVAANFIQNVKALSNKSKFNDEELQLIFNTLQEAFSMSPLEVMSLLDNTAIIVEEAAKEMPEEDLAKIRTQLTGE